MTTNNAKPALPIISDAQEHQILSSLESLHAAVVSYGAETLPAWENCGPVEYERIVTRGIKALAKLAADRKERAIAHLRAGVKETLTPYIAEHRARKEQYDAAFASVPQAMRAHIKAFDATIEVPVSEFASIFPTGTEVTRMVVSLKDMGYSILKGKEGFSLRLQVPFTSGTAAQGTDKAA